MRGSVVRYVFKMVGAAESSGAIHLCVVWREIRAGDGDHSIKQKSGLSPAARMTLMKVRKKVETDTSPMIRYVLVLEEDRGWRAVVTRE